MLRLKLKRSRIVTGVMVGFLVALVIGLLSRSHGKTVNDMEYFENLHGDLTSVTWAHAVNSKALLMQALNDDDIMMLEADVRMGKILKADGKESKKIIPVMAHDASSNVTSDLGLKEFLKEVRDKTDFKKKGIKLDFKDMESVVPALEILNKTSIDFPVWLNADVFCGPVNAAPPKINAEAFFNAYKTYAPQATLSIGWTTRFGNIVVSSDGNEYNETIREGKYTSQHIQDALNFLNNKTINGRLTFPVRAAIAVQSISELEELLGKAGVKASLTLWSPENEEVSLDKINHLITLINADRIYVDVPFFRPQMTSIPTSTSITKTTTKATESPRKKIDKVTDKPTHKDKSSKKDNSRQDMLITADENEIEPGANGNVGSTAVLSTIMLVLAFMVLLS